MKELTTEARTDNLGSVLAFVDELLDNVDCPMKLHMQIDLAVEEVFVNVSSYAYRGTDAAAGSGLVTIRLEDDPAGVTITFTDSGIPFDPLAMKSPDVTLPAKDREIGGLGIFLVRKSMDDVRYEFRNGQNVLTIRKNW